MEDKIDAVDKEKSLYLTQIWSLGEKLERCQFKCDELEKQNKRLASLHSLLETDKKDIAEYLKHSAAVKQKEAEELVERLENQQQVTEQHREALKLQHRQELQELQERTDELTSQRTTQMLMLEEQREQLMQLMQLVKQMSDREALEKQLVSEKKEHEAAIRRLRREAALERGKVTAQRNKSARDCIKMKVSKALVEERAQHSQTLEDIRVLLDHNMALWKEKDALRDRQSHLCFDMDKLRKDLSKVTEDNSSLEMEAEQLTKKSQQLRVKLKDRTVAHEHTLAKEEALRQLMASVSEDCRQKTAEADQLGVEIQEQRSRRWQLEGVIQEAVITLEHILTDSEETSEAQWKMQRLLEILESTAPQGSGSAPNNPTEKSSRGQKPQTSGPEAARAETLNLSTDPLFLWARYRLGDFGFVPRPTWKHTPGTSGTGGTSRTGGTSGTRARSTGTQLPLSSQETSSSVSSAPQEAESGAGASSSAD